MTAFSKKFTGRLKIPVGTLESYARQPRSWFQLCRTCKFFDVFGIALSMNILICISLDRFYSIFFPLYAMRARKSVQKMVIVAWITSFATSAPQVW
ncbi:hypothetical protein ANCCAN_16129 [Ancylostoma caninum]|uniref:G-protein coupled receptors family 1 profile domain-containing protein n=1 Tax=Ancylostoma caninum TaxID=29170 RepID=A0A368G4Q0_ANCCA|nr:hypothetical protein ANCCAN_16129 [Ancylostoma caninum]